MSYADATLDLSLLPIVCLTGLNGAGKSALLDALTWSLWETGRSGSDELIRLGEKEMWVDLTFIHESEKYRVRRSRQKMSAKAGARITSKGTLEFQIFNKSKQPLAIAAGASGNGSALAEKQALDDDQGRRDLECPLSLGSWRSLTGASVKQTQKLITDMLRMDFDTFVNSAYLRQGKADEFITRAPSERKQVLSDILGLAYFDRLQEKAKERVRTLRADAEIITREMTILPEIEAALSQATEHLSEKMELWHAAGQQLAALETDCDKLMQELAVREFASSRLNIGEEQTKALGHDLSNLCTQRDVLHASLEKFKKILAREQEIENASSAFIELKMQVEILDKQAFEVQEFTTEKLTMQHQLATMRARLEVELESATARAQELEDKATKYDKDTQEKDKITTAYAEYRRTLHDEADLASRQETFARMSNRANELASQINESKIRLEADLFQKEQSINEYETVLHSQQNLEAQKDELEEETKQLDKLEAEFEYVEEAGIKLKSNIESKQQKVEVLRVQQHDKQKKIDELHLHCDSAICPLCAAPIVDRAAVVERYQQEMAQTQNQITAEEAAIGSLEQERLELRKRYMEVRASLQRRQLLDKQVGQFNEKLAAIERAKSSVEKIKNDLQTLQSRLQSDNYAQLERESLIGIKAELHKLEFDPIAYANLQSQLRMQRHIEVRFQQMNRDIGELKKLNETLPAVQELVKKLHDELSSESYGIEQRKVLIEIQGKLASFNYDRVLHSQKKLAMTSLMPVAELKQALITAKDEAPRLDESLKLCERQIDSKSEQVAAIEKERVELSVALSEIPELRYKSESLKSQLQNMRDNRETRSKEIAVLDAECTSLTADARRLNQAQQELKLITDNLDDHIFLAEAFGKKGIQAVIIENAIPEIETEANRILSKLTENKMHVAFVTQQKNKSGTTMETLDLLIGDEIGTRNYELFSGGEAFKVNFAVRVALSKLLARRSGAKLETLIVDEGFGSQDEASRERLVRAIQAIQNEFARIIVITHMSDIKDMFPVQINVEKEQGASRLTTIF